MVRFGGGSRRGFGRPGIRTVRKPLDDVVSDESARLAPEVKQEVQDAFVEARIRGTPYEAQFNGITASVGKIQVRYNKDPEDGERFEDLPAVYSCDSGDYRVEYRQIGRVKAQGE